MKRLERYLLAELTKMLLLSLGAFVLIFVAVEALERAERVLHEGIPLGVLALYMLYKLPAYLVEALPFALLVATMVSLGIMGRRREILAMKVHGVGNYSLLLPPLFASLVVAGVIFVALEGVVPNLLTRAERLWDVKIKGKPQKAFFQASRVWYLGQGRIYNIRLVQGDELRGFTVLELGDGMELRRRLDARRGRYVEGMWVLEDVTIREFGPDGLKERHLKRFELSLPEAPEDFQRGMKDPEEMGYGELRRYVQKLRSEGYDPTRYVVSLHAKVAYPLASMILVLVGVPLALWTARRKEGGIPLGIALSVMVGGVYWVAFAVAVAAGQGGLMPPWLSAWGANIFFAALGLYLLESLPY